MSWPGITDFSEAVQNPSLCFNGTELEDGKVATNQRGMPMVFSGSFACVYSVSVNGGAYAVRCFTREVKDQQDRYNQLSDYLINVLPPSFVHFEYVEDGICLKGDWYPIVKMEWVEGEVLSAFVGDALDEPDTLRRVAAQWRGGTTASLRGLRIAHNDLQHGNVMVQDNGNIRLVDYDGMFLPQFRGERSPELGHKNYQHPQRSAADYGDYVDNFPTLVIYLSLLAVAADPDLWSFFNDDNLIFTAKDYADPGASEVFKRVKKSKDPAVVELTKRLEEYCALPKVDAVPDLETILQDIPPSAAPAPASMASAQAAAKKKAEARKKAAAKKRAEAKKKAEARKKAAAKKAAAASKPPLGPASLSRTAAHPGSATAPPARPGLTATGRRRRQPRALPRPAPAPAQPTVRQATQAARATLSQVTVPPPKEAARDFLKILLGIAATVLIIVVVITVLAVWAIAQNGW